MAHVDGNSMIEMPLRFPGHYFDEETGVHYNRFRYFSPELGRYIQSDPAGLFGGINLYAYLSDPLSHVDIDGLAGKGKGGNGRKPKTEKTSETLEPGCAMLNIKGEGFVKKLRAQEIRTYTVSLPLTLYMHVARRTPGVGQENVTSLFFMARPIAERETHFYFGLSRNFGLDQPDQVWADRNTAVTEQDRVIVEAQRPELLPLDLSDELHLRGTDAAAVEYRRALKRLGVQW